MARNRARPSALARPAPVSAATKRVSVRTPRHRVVGRGFDVGERTRLVVSDYASARPRALQAIVADFEGRDAHLTGVAIADTAVMLESLAARWGIEESFKTLKHHLDIEGFAGELPQSIEQEIQAKALRYNITQALCSQAQEKVDEKKVVFR